jgi:CRP-like cAMP-binding protein
MLMARRSPPVFTPNAFLANVSYGKTVIHCKKNTRLFSQGDRANTVFYIQEGQVTLSVTSQHGKEAVAAILEKGAFCGEYCLAGQKVCLATATPTKGSTIVRITKAAMIRALHSNSAFSELFMAHLLTRNMRTVSDLVDQLFNSSEKRLARALLLLAHFGKNGRPETVITKISQKTLAEMVGTTRSRVSFFMNKFRDLGFVRYNGELEVHSSLLSVALAE